MKYTASAAETEFSEMHIQLTWEELHTRFGFDLKTWKKKFHDYRSKNAREKDEVALFYRFGNDRINPILNEILGRSPGFPTFNRLVVYITRKH
jgi:hypothetical protein